MFLNVLYGKIENEETKEAMEFLDLQEIPYRFEPTHEGDEYQEIVELSTPVDVYKGLDQIKNIFGNGQKFISDQV